MENSDNEWFYCLKHRRPERGRQEPEQFLLGPFPDEATAARALDIIREREARKEAEDRAWSGED
jgi:hypothetical protein